MTRAVTTKHSPNQVTGHTDTCNPSLINRPCRGARTEDVEFTLEHLLDACERLLPLVSVSSSL